MTARTPKRTRPSGVSAATREKILQGAADAFGRLGYAKLRVEDIIDAAGVSRPTFYKVYGSKDEVFQVLSERHHREIQRRILAAVQENTDAVAQLAAMVNTFMQWRAGLGAVGRVLDLEARTPGTTVAHHRDKTLKQIAKLSAALTAAAGRDPVDPVLTVALISALESVADALLLKPQHNLANLERAQLIAFRLAAGALAEPGDPLPPIPRPPVARTRATTTAAKRATKRQQLPRG